MSERPYMPLYVADYLGDTQHLTTEQHGAYLLLLMTMWRVGGVLPNNPAKLARIARVSPRRWKLICDDVMAFFTIDAERITAPIFDTWKKLGGRNRIPVELRQYIWDRDEGRCVYCRSVSEPMHIDHVIPWSRGGGDDPDNLCLACKQCNLSKGDKTPGEWLQ